MAHLSYKERYRRDKWSRWSKAKIEDITEIKPWVDPESLFCDTEFLEKLMGKSPKPGKVCKDGK